MRQQRPYSFTSLSTAWIALLLCGIFKASAFPPCRDISRIGHIHPRDAPLPISIVISSPTLTRPKLPSQLWAADDSVEAATEDDDDKINWFKIGQHMAKELKESEGEEDEEGEEVPQNDNTEGDKEGDGDSSNELLDQAQTISHEAARSLVASTASICQMKEEDLRTIQTDIQDLKDKLTMLQEQECLLEEEVALARSSHMQSVEKELAILGAFQALTTTIKNKDTL